MSYQDRDWEIIDYQSYQIDGCEAWFRGPKNWPTSKLRYGVCLGAAQTFGCFCEKPYPTLLSEHLGFPIINLGVAGASPKFFLNHWDKLGDLINGARFVIVQIMSGRSESNNFFEVRDGRRAGAVIRKKDGKLLMWEDAYQEIFGTDDFDQSIKECINNWKINYQTLLGLICAHKILFWFSGRKPGKKVSGRGGLLRVGEIFGSFPQLIDQQLINWIKPLANDYVETVCNVGLPQPLISRFTGKPCVIDLAHDEAIYSGRIQKMNYYYPSPQMHKQAFEDLSKHI